MAAKVYTETVLPQIIEDYREQDLKLCQEADSAHTSQSTMSWTKNYDLSLITIPGVSPDLTILEPKAHPVEKAFHSRQCTKEKAGLTRFIQIFEKEMDQETIQRMYSKYTKRLPDYMPGEKANDEVLDRYIISTLGSLRTDLFGSLLSPPNRQTLPRRSYLVFHLSQGYSIRHSMFHLE